MALDSRSIFSFGFHVCCRVGNGYAMLTSFKSSAAPRLLWSGAKGTSSAIMKVSKHTRASFYLFLLKFLFTFFVFMPSVSAHVLHTQWWKQHPRPTISGTVTLLTCCCCRTLQSTPLCMHKQQKSIAATDSVESSCIIVVHFLSWSASCKSACKRREQHCNA